MNSAAANAAMETPLPASDPIAVVPAATDGNLRPRLLSIAVLAPAVLLIAGLGGWVFVAAAAIGTAFGLLEWLRLIEPGAGNFLIGSALAALFAVLLVAALGWPANGFLLLIVLTAALWWLAFNLKRDARQAGLVALGLPYMAGAGLALIYLRAEAGGGATIFFLLASVWGTDSGAYGAGRFFGGPKLAPRVSPNKTWSGCAGGIALGVLAGAVTAWAFGLRPVAGYLALAFFLSIAAQAGDLFKSFFKRRAGVKDSGALIPGHGGMLDRIDGLAFAALFLALYQAMLA
jgi:phosphatidate cytidylyltransferase